jgi:ankyrin repeat protein
MGEPLLCGRAHVDIKTFLSLPTEIIILVGGCLTRSSLNLLAQSCKFLRTVLNPCLYRLDAETGLLWAAREGNVATAILSIQAGANLEITCPEDPLYGTPLRLAAYHGHEAVVQVLLKTGKCDPKARKDGDGSTLLHLAATNGHEAVVKLLLQTPEVDVNAAVKMLIEAGKSDPKARGGDDGSTALHLAAMNGHEAVVKLLLQTSEVDVNAQDGKLRTPLMYAAMRGHEAVVELFLQTDRVDVIASDDYMLTALHFAATNGSEAVVRLLLRNRKIDPEGHAATARVSTLGGDDLGSAFPQYSHFGTPLCLAAYYGHEAVAKLFLDTGTCDPNARREDDASTPLHNAVKHGHMAVVGLLLQTAGVDLNATDRSMNTPLHDAVLNGRVAAVELLLQTAGVDVNLLNEDLRTPLMCAERECTKVVALLTGPYLVDRRPSPP